MHYLWMELDAVELFFVVGDRSTGSIRMRQHLKPTGNKVHESPWLIHMVVPSSTLVSKSVGSSINDALPYSPLYLYYFTQLLYHQLHTVRRPGSGYPIAKFRDRSEERRHKLN